MPRFGFPRLRMAAPVRPAVGRPGPWTDHRLWALVGILILGAWSLARASSLSTFLASWLISCAGAAIVYWCAVVWASLFGHDDRE